jgi:uncharacterized protein
MRIFSLFFLGACFFIAGLSTAKAQDFRAFVVYSKASDHIVMSTRAKALITQLGASNNFTADFTSDTSLINDTNLAKYQLFIQLHLAPFEMSAKQQAAFQKFITAGKGWVGIHGAGLTGAQFIGSSTPYWQWYENFFGGVVYSPHPAYQRGTIIVEDRTHPVTKNLPASFQIWDEWYEFNKSPRPDVHVLGKADESTYTQVKPMGDHPMIWVNEKAPNRMVYICAGHDSSACGNANWVTLFHDAIMWAGTIQTDIKNTPGPVHRKEVIVERTSQFISLRLPESDLAGVTIMDESGRQIFKVRGEKGICRFRRNEVCNGVYLVRLKSHGATLFQKLLISY